MAKGLIGTGSFGQLLSYEEKIVAKRLAEIEREDADRCEQCGGEDCCCCEYYLDRQKWVEPADLFGWY